MAFTPVNDGDLAVASQIQQIIDALQGVPGAGQQLLLTQFENASEHAVEIANLGSGGLGLLVSSSAAAPLLDVRDAYLSMDNGTLYVDVANNRVGINDTTPSVALDVTGDVNVTGALTTGSFSASTLSLAAGTVGAPSLAGTAGSANTGLYFPATDQLGITVDGTQRGNWTSSGLTLTGGLFATQSGGVSSPVATFRNTISGGSIFQVKKADNSANRAELFENMLYSSETTGYDTWGIGLGTGLSNSRFAVANIYAGGGALDPSYVLADFGLTVTNDGGDNGALRAVVRQQTALGGDFGARAGEFHASQQRTDGNTTYGWAGLEVSCNSMTPSGSDSGHRNNGIFVYANTNQWAGNAGAGVPQDTAFLAMHGYDGWHDAFRFLGASPGFTEHWRVAGGTRSGDNPGDVVTATGRWRGGDGDNVTPGFGFGGNVGLGFFRPATGTIDVATSAARRTRWDAVGNLVHGVGALATSATDGWFYLPTTAGAPTGTPTAYGGMAPLDVDTTNERIYYYNSGWKYAETVQGTSFARKNRLINGSFAVKSRNTLGSTDDSYILDRWVLLLEAASAAAASQETSDVPSDGANTALKLTVGAGEDNKFGVVQLLSSADSKDLRGKKVSLQFKMKATAGITNVRAAVLEWTSTADTVTSDVVGTWGADGTNPTLATNWAYCSGYTPVSLAATTSWATYKIQDVTVGASANNLAVFIWCDDETTTVTTDVLRLTDVQLEEGTLCTKIERRPKALEESLCRFFYEELGGDNLNQSFGIGIMATASAIDFVMYHAPKRISPAVTLSAASDFNVGTSAAQTAGSSYSVNDSSRTNACLRINTTASHTGGAAGRVTAANTLNARYIVDAEL